jgi:hypothetical protein
MPVRAHERPTAIRTMRFASGFGPRDAARIVALSRAALNSADVMLIAYRLLRWPLAGQT